MLDINLKKLTSSVLKDIRREAYRFLDHLDSYELDDYDFYFYDLQELKDKELDLIQEINEIIKERVYAKN